MSINQYIMNSLLDNQKVRKRKSTGLTKSSAVSRTARRKTFSRGAPKPAFRPAGIVSLFSRNSRIIDDIKQEPARLHRVPRRGLRAASTEPQDALPGKEGFFSIPAIPFAALLLLGIGIFFVIYSSSGTLAWMSRDAVSSEKDSGSQYNLALYAGINAVESIREEPAQAEAIPLDLAETFSWQSYKVKKGDSVSKIAAAFSVSMDAIIASNGITNARSLREGETLRIPNMDGIPYTVKNGDSLGKISQSMGVPLEAILDANDLQNDFISSGMTLFIPGARMNREDLKLALGELFLYPVRGARLSSPFGWRNDPFTGVRSYHAAIDLSCPQGTPIKSAMDGKVSALGYNATYGNYLILSHSGGYQTMYAHLFSFSVKKGDQVGQGSLIGAVGTTGYSTGPHLHFAVFKNGKAVNPLDFLGPQK